MPKQRTLRCKKRAFSGNQFVDARAKTTGSEVSDDGCASSSSNNQSGESHHVSTVSGRKLSLVSITMEIPQEGPCEHEAANGVYISQDTGLWIWKFLEVYSHH